jgi:ubiquinol-cytochrome c reductase iron-sulfur subunit
MNIVPNPSAAAGSAPNRRRFLYATTAAVGAAGLAGAAWPLIAQMNPDAAVRAARDIVEVDLAGLAAGTQQIVRWRNRPIFVVARTPAMLAAMREAALVRRLIDPRSDKRQQPAYAKSWHRSLDPAFAVLVGVCTRCSCVPTYVTDASGPDDVTGGYVCPCCAARYDPAGRTYTGITPYNLPVPPHDIVAPSRLRVGRNAGNELFTIEMVEVI